MLKVYLVSLFFIVLCSNQLQAQDRLGFQIGESTYEQMLSSLSELQLFLTDYPGIFAGCNRWTTEDMTPERRYLREIYNLPNNSRKIIDLYLVRDREDQSVVVAVAKVNRKQFEKMQFHYRSGTDGQDDIHHGTLSIGNFVQTNGSLIFNNDQISLQANNEINVATLYKGENVRITNFEGFSLDTQVQLNDRGGEFRILGRSGIALDIEPTRINALEMARLKFNVGAGSGVEDGVRRPVIESILNLELNFN